ncbi:MAG: transglycosylase SLT domain-containing protein [Bdellovibrionales bacterium]|nr:transglycosylase SLT domain-containing protein [Bdellovibrionales bacterium]
MQSLSPMAPQNPGFILVVLALIAMIGCGPVGRESINSKGGTISNPETEMYKAEPLLWEGQTKDGLLWSAFVFQVIGAEAASVLLPGSDDVREFCPAYDNISNAQRVNFWAFLISAIAKYESAFDPQARVMLSGTDEVTGKRTYAEGLMQLSYRDIRTYAFCAFDWEKDKKLSLQDTARTIWDPLKSLDCGIKILATQIESVKKIGHASTYWNALKPSGIKSRLTEIKTASKALPFCKN